MNTIFKNGLENGSLYALAGVAVGGLCLLSNNKNIRNLGIGIASAGVGTWLVKKALPSTPTQMQLAATRRKRQPLIFANRDVESFVNLYARQDPNASRLKRRYFHPGFAAIVTRMNQSPENFYITNDESYFTKKDSEGEFYYDGNRFIVVFKNNPSIFYGSRAGAMFEEFCHVQQFFEGKLWFQKVGSIWAIQGGNGVLEYEAKRFATTAKDYGKTYNANDSRNPKYTETYLGLIATMPLQQGVNMLLFGYVKSEFNIYTNILENFEYPPLYPDLIGRNAHIANRPLKITTNETYAYPYPAHQR